MIENDLRALLADRLAGLPDNPTRVADVRSRVRRTKRRRTAGAALSLVLLALAGLGLTRLPGRPEALPTGAPAGPYFAADGTIGPVPGYAGRLPFSFREDAVWGAGAPAPGLRRVVVARCSSPADLTLRNRSGGGPELTLRCRVPVSGHYEGALPIEPDLAGQLFAEAGANVEVGPSSPGDWTVGVLDTLYPERLTAADLSGALLSGFDSPAGGRIPLIVPGNVEFSRRLIIAVRCVRDVRLAFSVAGRPLAVATCDDTQDGNVGVVVADVPDAVLGGLGIRPGQRIVMDVRSTGRQTDQWAVLDVG